MKIGTWLRHRREFTFAIVRESSEEWVVLGIEDSLIKQVLRPLEVKRDWYTFRRVPSLESSAPLPEWAEVGAIVATYEDSARYEVAEIRYGHWIRLEMLGLPDRTYFRICWKPYFTEFMKVPTRFEKLLVEVP